MSCLVLALLLAAAVAAVMCCARAKCARCRILCGCGAPGPGEGGAVEPMLPNRLPPAYGPFWAPSAQTLPRAAKRDAKKLGDRLFARGWVFVAADCQNCDAEDAAPQGPGSAVLGVEGIRVVNAENEPGFALAAGVQEPPGWFNMRTGQYIPNILPRDALEVLASPTEG